MLTSADLQLLAYDAHRKGVHATAGVGALRSDLKSLEARQGHRPDGADIAPDSHLADLEHDAYYASDNVEGSHPYVEDHMCNGKVERPMHGYVDGLVINGGAAQQWHRRGEHTPQSAVRIAPLAHLQRPRATPAAPMTAFRL